MDLYRFKMASGETVVGAVQGSGGVLSEATSGLERLRIAQRLFEAGREVASLYQPAPGCVAVMPDYSAGSDGRRVSVPLVGAKISLVRRRAVVPGAMGATEDAT